MRRMPLNAEELEKFIILSGKFNFTNETLEHVLEDELYGKIAVQILECRKKGIRKGVIIEDIEYGGCYVGEILDDGTATLIQTNISSASSVDLQIDTTDKNNIKLVVSTNYANYLTADDAPKMYRHQMTITDQGNVAVDYIVYASNNLEINNLENFVTVTKANSNYTGLASYLGADGNVHPAYIRYSFGNVVIQLQSGSVSPMKSVSDIVTTI